MNRFCYKILFLCCLLAAAFPTTVEAKKRPNRPRRRKGRKLGKSSRSGAIYYHAESNSYFDGNGNQLVVMGAMDSSPQHITGVSSTTTGQQGVGAATTQTFAQPVNAFGGACGKGGGACVGVQQIQVSSAVQPIQGVQPVTGVVPVNAFGGACGKGGGPCVAVANIQGVQGGQQFVQVSGVEFGSKSKKGNQASLVQEVNAFGTSCGKGKGGGGVGCIINLPVTNPIATPAPFVSVAGKYPVMLSYSCSFLNVTVTVTPTNFSNTLSAVYCI